MARRKKTSRNRSRKRLPPAAILVLALIGWGLKHYGILDQLQPGTVSDASGQNLVVRVVDGDTLVLGNDERVRLIGVDTPETKHPTKPVEPLGPEASAFTKRAVEGKQVTLRFDREKYDRYQRVLAYVYVGDWCLNEELIRAGLSECVTRYPFDASMKRRFREAESEARAARRGIWR
ncbi:MAG: thermonuclease family protein [Planctomycetota bacterium]|nr:thermonuclease family protein [Planctomycetota bacterium]MDA1247902.1 thermonuclease family protein [Planctomycetota bacterium]